MENDMKKGSVPFSRSLRAAGFDAGADHHGQFRFACGPALRAGAAAADDAVAARGLRETMAAVDDGGAG